MAEKEGFEHIFYSSKPGFLEKYIVDGGLVILSKYPMVETDEHIYKKNIGDCSISKKGVLFTKIDINGNYIYLFNTHLQANYYTSFEYYKSCINTKMYQIKQLSDYIELKTNNMRSQDIIMVLGDFNISSRKYNKNMMNVFKERLEVDDGFKIFFEPKFECTYEHEIMLKLLRSDGLFNVNDLKDHIADEDGGPATFAGSLTLEDGTKVPTDTALMGKHDLMTEQSLDYIFMLERVDVSNRARDEDRKESRGSDPNGYNVHRLLGGSNEFTVLEDTIKVQMFLTEGKEYGTLSDHYGLSVDVRKAM
mmetsp:Transcript_11031/g.9761  ORF Transcript_11031/g.9761 Transcript_11031/m.9761 type:complete len:306 (-) Transcript_11031:99-1016(-)